MKIVCAIIIIYGSLFGWLVQQVLPRQELPVPSPQPPISEPAQTGVDEIVFPNIIEEMPDIVQNWSIEELNQIVEEDLAVLEKQLLGRK